MRARIIIEAVWAPHVDPDDTPEGFLRSMADTLVAEPEALAEFLDRDEVIVTVDGEWL